jgi:hypothetical protein
MNTITFINRKTQIPGWVNTLHINNPRGYAYKKDSFCISIYGRNHDIYTISPGLTASQESKLDITDWVNLNFDADNIENLNLKAGEVITGVWRPGLYYDNEIEQALNITTYQRMLGEQALYILLEKLNDLFLYIEPSITGLQSYSHKTRELLILSCTEVENSWCQYMIIAGGSQTTRYTTKDYVKLLQPLYLAEYEVKIKPYQNLRSFKPFATWHDKAPTNSLSWYDAYNKTKHNRDSFFAEATLERCIESVAANIIMFCIKYGPYILFNGRGITSSHFNQFFSINLDNPDPKTFYVPNVKLSDRRKDFVCGSAEIEDWIRKPLVI